jgi:ABC-2 type transport system ATP-binding protein
MHSTCTRTFAVDDALRMEGVGVRFGAFVALDGVSLHVPSGSITGLIGRNGAGKTTSIRALAGLLQPDAGNIQVLGMRWPDDGVEIKRSTGYLLSEPALFAYLTPEETLRFLGEAYGVPTLEAGRRAEYLLRFFGLWDARNRLIDGFSTGMQKRLSLAAALVHAPRLLVLDEPFESLDPLMVRRVKGLLVEYARGGGTTLLSSHLIGAVEELCDHIAILEHGRVLVAGPTEEAKQQAVGTLGPATLEELYASVVDDDEPPSLDWLSASGA